MAKKKKNASNQKILFMDTNVFINCAAEEAEGSNIAVLEDIYKKINSNNLILIIPETMRREIILGLESKFLDLIKEVENHLPNEINKKNESMKISKVVENTVKEARKEALEKIENKKKKIISLVDKIFEHKNTEKIELTDKLVLSGLKRALLMKAPYTPPRDLLPNQVNTRGKSSYLKDQDCVIFESLLEYLSSEKKSKERECIICVDDSDYCSSKNEDTLHKDIKHDIAKKCKNISFYRNPLKMMNEKFEQKYSDSAVKRYKESAEFRRGLLSETREPLFSNSYRRYNYDLRRNPELHRIRASKIPSYASYYRRVPAGTISLHENIRECPICNESIEREMFREITYRRHGLRSEYLRCPHCQHLLEIENE